MKPYETLFGKMKAIQVGQLDEDELQRIGKELKPYDVRVEMVTGWMFCSRRLTLTDKYTGAVHVAAPDDWITIKDTCGVMLSVRSNIEFQKIKKGCE